MIFTKPQVPEATWTHSSPIHVLKVRLVSQRRKNSARRRMPSMARLQALAKKSPPPQYWFDEPA